MVPSIFRSNARPPLTKINDPNLSPTLSATTAASRDFDLEGNRIPIITRADLRSSVAAYENVLQTAKVYRTSLQASSAASTSFAGALEEAARVKGAGESGEQLLAASGVQYMISNSSLVLSDTLYRQIEVPLLHSYDAYVSSMANRHMEYENILQIKTTAIRNTELENLKQGRKKSRDLSQFRRALEKLQEQVREVEVCKGSYYAEVHETEVENWENIAGKMALLLRSTLDLADRLASKATSDAVIEGMLNEHPDPFDSYRLESEEERDVFSILPPLGMNLGVGGSKKGSMIDAVKDDISSTPRQQRPIAPPRVISVADALGLNENQPSYQASSDTTSIPDLPDHYITPFAYPPSTSSSSSPSPSPPLHPTSNDNLNDLNYNDDEVSTIPPQHTDIFSASSSRTKINTNTSTFTSNHLDSNSLASDILSPTSPSKHSHRRPLSRVVEREREPPADPFQGDWDVRDYGKSLSPTHNGNGADSYYSSSEERG